jgi:hypothetical protein
MGVEGGLESLSGVGPELPDEPERREQHGHAEDNQVVHAAHPECVLTHHQGKKKN